jgi:preprotein translocase subunit SecF
MPLMVALSVTIIVLSLASIVMKGFNFSIDFEGGTVLEVQVPAAAGEVDEQRLREVLAKLGQPDATIVRLGAPEDREFRISMRGSQEEDRNLSVTLLKGLNDALATEVVAKSVESVGPRVGSELRRAGVTAIVLSWIGILVYVWFRFEWQYAPGAVLALVHDVCFTAGLFSFFGWEFDMNVLAALLVIIGYSMNDTIVIYDRIRETVATRGTTELESVVNEAINSTLSRTILTSGITQLVVVALLLVGGPVLRGFALALFIGILVGTYSSVYVASAVLIWLARRYGHPVAAQKKPERRARPSRAST